MELFSIVTALVALSALTLAIIQFVNRHRPFVGLSNARLVNVFHDKDEPRVDGLPQVEIKVRNWGEVTAESVDLQLDWWSIEGDLTTHTRHVGLLFPGQEILLFEIGEYPPPPPGGDNTVYFDWRVSYTSAIKVGKWSWRLDSYKHEQKIFATRKDWGVLAPLTRESPTDRSDD